MQREKPYLPLTSSEVSRDINGPVSVSQEYLALPDGAGNFKRGVSNPALLRILPLPSNFLYGAITLYGPASHPVHVVFGFDYVVLLPPVSLN